MPRRTLRSNRGAWTVNNEKQVGGPVNCSDSELCTFLQALGEGYLPTYYSDTNQSAQSKSMSIVSRSYQRGKKTVAFHGFQSLQMSRNLTAGRGAELLTWFLAASHARTSANAEREPGLTVPAPVCGQTWRESSVRFDRDSCSWKTHRLLFDADLPESSAILPVWGRMSAAGVVLERTTVPLHTSAKDAGLSECWPTPLSRDGKDTPGMALEGVNPDGSERSRTDTLPRAVWARAKRMWPTPRAEEGGPDFAKVERGKRTGQSVSPSLATAVALEGGSGLGPLNPTFREWLMGWPIGWSARRPLATDRFREWLLWHGIFSPRVSMNTQNKEVP
jgi:hypothetical protein